MPDEKNFGNNFEALFIQQQEFNKTLLLQQQTWMQSMLNNQAGGAPGSINVPSFHNFNKEQQSWDSYLEQLSQHFQAYGVTLPERQKSFFLSWIGTEIFELLKNLFGSANLQQQTFKQLAEKLTEHFQSKRHVVAARYEFLKRDMLPHQKYREWVADLRGLARDCNFVCSAANCSGNYIDEMIRDQIILRTPHDSVRASALQKVQPSLYDVMLIAEAFETTTNSVTTIKGKVDELTTPVNAIRTESFRNRKLKSCPGCDRTHTREQCKFRNAICNKCAKKGHIAAVCISKQFESDNSSVNNDRDRAKRQSNRERRRNVYANDEIDSIETVFNVTGKIHCGNNKAFIETKIFDKIITFQMDSGASVSVITIDTYKQLNCPKLIKCNKTLFGFGQKPIPVLGQFETNIKCGKYEKSAVLVVADVENGNNLFGSDLFRLFKFEIHQIANVTDNKIKAKELCEKYNKIFEIALGTIKEFKAKIYLRQDAIPKFCRSRQIPFAQMSTFRKEVDRLVRTGIWKPVKFSDWASPIVLVTKPDGSLRICGDFKIAVNAQIDIEQYPLPTRECLFYKLRNGNIFSKIDLRDAYLQMELDEESKKFMVVNTPLGLFQYQRLPYGIASAPAIFQKYIEQLLQGIEGCGNYLDDIVVTASSLSEHLHRLEQVLRILQSNGISCKLQKCVFLTDKIEYLGRKISSDGISPDDSGVEAVEKLQPPSNIKQVEAFMGKVNYYHNFIPNFANLSAPINLLRRKAVRFVWGPEQQKAFSALKDHIVNATQLAHYQDDLPLILAADASAYGVGAVISHTYPDGTERPIAFASKTLDIHQIKYSQIEKEGLAIIFGVRRFHQYLYGRNFTLITDHKPLVSIFSPNKHLPTMSAHRIQRWAITLMAYQFDIKYRKTVEHGNADALSRLPIGTDLEFDREEACYNIEYIQTPINAKLVLDYTERDKILQRVIKFVENGWPIKLKATDNDIIPYFNRRRALIIHNNMLCLQTGVNRIVIPTELQPQVLRMLHDGHWGIARMKQLARQHCWWVNIDSDIERIAAGCDTCKLENPAPANHYNSWPDTCRPWERVHIDFAGPIFGSMWLICVDAFSQFPYVTQLSTTTSNDTISALSAIFAIEGLPETLVSDNGPQLTADCFKRFCTQNGIKHLTTAPFHPASNGLAETFVQTFKTAVRKNISDGLQLKAAVVKYLATYRFSPNADGKTPFELIHGRPGRTILSQLFETTKMKPTENIPKFVVKEKVYVMNYARGPKWIKGVITRHLGQMMYEVHTSSGYWRRHQNQLKLRNSGDDTELENEIPAKLIIDPIVSSSTTLSGENVSDHNTEHNSGNSQSTMDTAMGEDIMLRRSFRSRVPVKRFQPQDFRK